MLLRLVYEEKLAQAAWVIGCQRTGEALVIDPQRDIDKYLQLAQREGLSVVAVAETHIHADFVSGARELANRCAARVYLSDEGGPDWKYAWPSAKPGGGAYEHRLLRDGDTFRIGGIEIKAVHTPGHTPEHLCYLVTDRGGGASEPMGLASGDFVFVGDVGRPDLLETAAGQAGATDPSARALYHSLRRFAGFPEYLQVWPGHGAGSACGKALGAVPQTTVGYEKRFSSALLAATDEDSFVRFILDGQPEPPLYFARMKRWNRDGPPLLADQPAPVELDAIALAERARRGDAVIVDLRPWRAFVADHLAGSLSIPPSQLFPTFAGSFLDEHDAIVLIGEPAQRAEAKLDLARVGLDRVIGLATPQTLDAALAAGAPRGSIEEIAASEARRRIESDGAFSLDVRSAGEFGEGHVGGARNIAYPRLAAHLNELPRDRAIVVNCKSGVRSARAVTLLARHGFRVANVAGGFLAWQQAGLPVANGASA